MDREVTTCRAQSNKRFCGAFVFVDEIPINQRTLQKCKPLCQKHFLMYQEQLRKARENPSEAIARARKKGHEKALKSEKYKDAMRRANARKHEKGTSANAHHLVTHALLNILTGKGTGERFIACSDFDSPEQVRRWFDNESKRRGFANGLLDRGRGALKWSVAHKIPKFAYDGTDMGELSKCWNSSNITCSTVSCNSRQGRNFNQEDVPVEFRPSDWPGGACPESRRKEILSQFSYE
jgi:hypothetical protein